MITSTFTVVALCFPIVSTGASISVEKGIASSYCGKSQVYPNSYGPTPVECCDARGACDQFILPNETKYGLINTDTKWPIRHCNCEYKLRECLLNDRIETNSLQPLNEYGFQYLSCFRENFVYIKGRKTRLYKSYAVTPFLVALSEGNY